MFFLTTIPPSALHSLLMHLGRCHELENISTVLYGPKRENSPKLKYKVHTSNRLPSVMFTNKRIITYIFRFYIPPSLCFKEHQSVTYLLLREQDDPSSLGAISLLCSFPIIDLVLATGFP